MNEAGLIEYARAVRNHAYAPYSDLKWSSNSGTFGPVYTGCNVENASYGLTIVLSEPQQPGPYRMEKENLCAWLW